MRIPKSRRAGVSLIEMIVVLAIWVFQLLASPVWLRYFRFGPAEWLWRSLTYFRRQPMRAQVFPAVPAAD